MWRKIAGRYHGPFGYIVAKNAEGFWFATTPKLSKIMKGLASGWSHETHKVDIDKWIAEVRDAFDLVDKM